MVSKGKAKQSVRQSSIFQFAQKMKNTDADADSWAESRANWADQVGREDLEEIDYSDENKENDRYHDEEEGNAQDFRVV